jgi:hypothetical protein
MPRTIDELVADLRSLEVEMEAVYARRREDIHFVVEKGRVRFSEAVVAQQRLRKIGLLPYLSRARVLSYIVAPVIYAGIIPLALLDLFCGIYQAICFPIYQITKVSRREYMVFDHGDLPYLNVLQKLNCFYCSYANGLAAYVREVSARTEQFFCPIKHARKIIAAHDRYPSFFEYGDAESFRNGLIRLQKELDSEGSRYPA